MAPRFASGAGMSLLITFGLLFVMQALIAVDEIPLDEPSQSFFFDIVRVVEDTEVVETIRVPDRPKPPEAWRAGSSSNSASARRAKSCRRGCSPRRTGASSAPRCAPSVAGATTRGSRTEKPSSTRAFACV